MSRLQVCKYDINLNPIWKKTYGRASIINSAYDAVLNTDGSLVIACGYSDSTSLPLMNLDGKGVILKINTNGDSLWMRQYNNYVTGIAPANYWETFYGIEKTLDGGYILCGAIVNKPQGKAWVVKTDSLGCIALGCGSIITEAIENTLLKNKFTIFPNPCSDILNVDAEAKYTNMQIINSLGQVIKEENVISQNNKNTIDIKDLPEGVYLLKLLDSTRSAIYGSISKTFVVSR